MEINTLRAALAPVNDIALLRLAPDLASFTEILAGGAHEKGVSLIAVEAYCTRARQAA